MMIQRSRCRMLTQAEIDDVFALWSGGYAVGVICDHLKITRDGFIARRLDQLAELPTRRRGVGSRSDPQKDPTPEEITERAAAIRAGWTESERLRRLASGRLADIRQRAVSGSALRAAYRSL